MRVAIFGENPNDTRALKYLLLGIRPDIDKRDVKEIRRPPTLNRDAGAKAVKSWAVAAAEALRGAESAGGRFEMVLAHCDADGPDNGAFARNRSNELAEAGLNAIAVVPVEEMESWWLLFPASTESVVPSWRGALKTSAFNTDAVPGPKEELIRRTRSKQPKRPYEEADSPTIAAAIVASGVFATRKIQSPSFDRFVRTLTHSDAKP